MQRKGTPSSKWFRNSTVLALSLLSLIGSLASSSAEPTGENFIPWTMVEGRDGHFYGGVLCGDKNSDAGGYLYAFNSDGEYQRVFHFPILHYSPRPFRQGSAPEGSLSIGQDGSIYGSTRDGGVFGGGVIFKINPEGKYSILHHYEWSGYKGPTLAARNGEVFTSIDGQPAAVLRLSKDGSHKMLRVNDWVSGITETANNEIVVATYNGALWRLGLNDEFQLLAGVGSFPHNLLPLPDGSVLCLTSQQIVRISSTGEVAIIHQFTTPYEGLTPQFLTIAKDGSYIGTTYEGGLQSSGTLFRIVPETNSFSLLMHLPAPGANGPGVKWMKGVFPLHAAAASGNLPPMAKDDIIESSRLNSINGALPKAEIDVLKNDVDADLDLLTIVSVGSAQHGVVEFDFVSQKITYTSNSLEVANDSFTYTVVDGGGGSSTASVVVRTNPAGRYIGNISSPVNLDTGDPGTLSGKLSVGIDANRNATARLDLLGKTYRLTGRFNEVNQFGRVLYTNERTGHSAGIRLWLKPNGKGWTVEATIRNNSLPFSGTCILKTQ